jgi:hypothetical protein
VISRFQRWDNGNPPIARPLPQTVGSPACIVGGESYASGLTINDPRRFRSWPALCFVQAPIEDWGWAAAVFRCDVQSWWADRAFELSNLFVGNISAAYRQRFPGAIVRHWGAERFFPQMQTAVHPDYLVVQFAETQNAEQALVQVMGGIQRPEDVGGFGSMNIWYTQAQRGLHRLSLQGGTDDVPILCVGYSYGAAAALVAAGICRQGNPDRVIRFLTFGAPRPGDQRLRDLLDLPTRGCCLANDNDAITAIAPDYDSCIPLRPIFGEQLRNFSVWRPALETWQQNPDGTVNPNVYPSLTSQELLELLTHVITTGTFFGYPGHVITEYQRRLRLRCPAAPAIAVGGIGFNARGVAGIGLGGNIVRPGRVGLVAEMPAAGKVGLVAELPAAGKVGLVSGTAVIGNRLGLRGNIVAGRQLGLRAQDVAGGHLGFKPLTLAAGHLGFKSIIVAGRQLGLRGEDVAGGQLGLLGFDGAIAEGSVGLPGASPPLPAIAVGGIGLYGPVPVVNTWTMYQGAIDGNVPPATFNFSGSDTGVAGTSQFSNNQYWAVAYRDLGTVKNTVGVTFTWHGIDGFGGPMVMTRVKITAGTGVQASLVFRGGGLQILLVDCNGLPTWSFTMFAFSGNVLAFTLGNSYTLWIDDDGTNVTGHMVDDNGLQSVSFVPVASDPTSTQVMVGWEAELIAQVFTSVFTAVMT